MKTYTIELQRIKAMSNNLGMVRARVDATVLANPAHRQNDGSDSDSGTEPSTILSLSVENARVLMLLLKTQLAEVDGRKGRSQR